MIIIGLTGGIGSGKSTVLKLFQELGMATYVADIEAKKLMNSDSELIGEVTKLLGGKSYINSRLNTEYISSIVFNDKVKLHALNALVHPKVHEHFKKFKDRETAKFVVYEAAILFESGGDSLCDFIVVVTADIEDKINRVMLRDGVSKKEVLERMDHQLSDDLKIRKADFVVRNGRLEQTKIQVATIYNMILEGIK